MKHVRSLFRGVVAATMVAATAMCRAAGEPDATALEFFEAKVRPILANRCYQCHSDETSELKGGLRLDLRQGITEGGESGPAIEPGDPDASRLIEAVRYTDVDLQMPPKGKLPPEEIAVLEEWVRRGAASPPDDGQPKATRQPGFNLAERKATHWVWQPVRAVSPPPARNAAWPADPIDRFVLAGLEAAGLPPAARADRRTLIRRAYFDLIGLPPPPEAVAAFVVDDSPDAIARLADGLLASPHFGERWARHWLDLVRYAETRGHEFDFAIPGAWAYRDYVIRAFNQDLPYDRFVREHIAGDLVRPPRLDAEGRINESILATAFWHLGEGVHSPVDIRQDELDRVDNQIDVMAKTFLGLTVACARCHDHKFDAIASRDYYALAGFLHSSSYRETPFEWQDHNRSVAARIRDLDERTRPVVLAAYAGLLRPVAQRLADYLLVAGQVARDKAGGTSPADASARAAQQNQLDAAVVSQWAAQIERARGDASDPLHPWAVVALEPAEPSAERLAALLQPIVTAWTSQRQHAAQLPPGTKCVVDYAQPDCAWIADGLAFGDGPATTGTVALGTPAERPIARLVERGWARSDGVDRGLPGMLRTPGFVIDSPMVWCRVAGVGQAFLCIDSHRLVQGPLHGETKKTIQTEQPIGLAFSVRDYQGQRAHVEFTPASGQFVAVGAVYQCESPPPDPAQPNGLVLALLERGLPTSRADLAARFAALASSALDALARDALSTATADDAARADDVRERARLAAWIVERADAFGFAGANRAELTTILDRYTAQRAALVAQIRPSAVAPAMLDGTAFDESVLIRGNHHTPGEVAHRRLLEAIVGPDAQMSGAGSGRLELARQLTDPANPLVARVMVNRLWQHLFGRGIVATVDNFGVLGEPPSHPELLDHLADRFVREGWSIKRMLRAMMLSSTYQLSAIAGADAARSDPDNRLLSHARVRRLEGEAIRDAILATSSQLDRRQFGPSVAVHLTPFMEGRGRPGESGPLDGNGRRSIYVAVRRNFLSPMMQAFDTPAPFNSMGRRSTSNVPAQALTLLNDPFVIEQARHWAAGALAAAAPTAEERVRSLYFSAFARLPADAELRAALEFLDTQGGKYGLPAAERMTALQVWADLAHVLLNAKEFIFIE